MALDIQLDTQPDLDIQLDIQPDEEHKILTPDLPLGALETLTTGGLGAFLGLGAGVAGGIKGSLTPGQTAQQGWEDYSQKFHNSALGKELAPQTESGKAIEQGVGKIIESMKEYAGDAFPSQLVGGIPGAEKLEPAIAGAATAIPELSMLLPFAGSKGKAAKPSVSKEKIAESFDKQKLDIQKDTDLAASDVAALREVLNAEKLRTEKAAGDATLKAAQEKANNELLIKFRQRAIEQEAAKKQVNEALAQKMEEARVPGDVTALKEVLEADRKRTATAAEDAATTKQLEELFVKQQAEEAAAKKAERPNVTSQETPEGQMSLFDQGDQMGQRNQFNAGNLGDWRIDENGMPVRIDKSLEALNVEQPLQRGLWGDELGPALGQERSLTAAIDMMPKGIRNRIDNKFAPGTTRGSALDLLRGEIKSDELRRASEAANRENGTYNPTETTFQPTAPLPTAPAGVWSPPTRASMVKPKETLLEAPRPLPEAPVVRHPTEGLAIVKTDTGYVAVKDGKPVGKLESNMTPEQNKQLQAMGEKLPASVSTVGVDPSVRGTGVGKALYDAWRADHGDNVAPSGQTTADAWKYWKRNAPEKVEAFVNQEAKRVVEGSQNALSSITDKEIRSKVAERANHMVDAKAVEITHPSETVINSEPLPPAQRPVPPDTIATPRSPEKIAEKQDLRKKSEVLNSVVKDKRLDEYEAVRTPEEAKQLALDGGLKDNAPSFVGRNLGSGANFHAIMTNNPLIKFLNTVMRDARTSAEKYSREYITSKDGLAPTWGKMTEVERIDAMNALMEGDRRQMKVPQDILDQVSPNVRKYIEGYYAANKQLFERGNEAKVQLGMKPTDYREGHVPGVFRGAYKALVTDKKGVKAVLSVDSKWQMKKAIEHIKKEMPDAEITDVKRKGLGEGYHQSDLLSGMNDLVTIMAENDPRFAEVQAIISEAVKKGNNSIFNFNTHELSKKGVVGNEGNKPWLDAKENAESFHKAMIQYFEEGALHHELQVPMKQIKDLTLDPELNMPKTKKYLDSYMQHVTGRSAANPIAKGVDYALDVTPKALGFGPQSTLKLTGAIKNRMSQVFMGFGNWTFTAAQMIQPMQTGAPNVLSAASRLGNSAYAPLAMAKGGTNFMRGAIELMTGKDMGLAAHEKQAMQYAVDRGLLNFSEMEKAYEGSQSKAMRMFDQAAEFNMKAGELTTRVPMFMSFVDLFHHDGIPMERALPLAENFTQHAMVDYHSWERPQVYQKMGVIGQFAGGLTTFKHNFVGQQVKHIKEIAKGNVLPIAASAASMVALTGIAGAPFYDELDNLYGTITDKFFGERKNIRDSFMGGLPEGVKSGLIPAATDIAIQSKFSSANMIPDYDRPGAAISPQLSAAGNILMDAIDVAKTGDKQAWAAMMYDLAPSGMKGVVEEKMMNEDGVLMSRDRTASYRRSPEEWNLRKWVGLKSNTEQLSKDADYRARAAIKADAEAAKKIGTDFKRSIRNDNIDTSKAAEYEQRAGEGSSKQMFSLQNFQNEIKRRNLTEKERQAAEMKPTPADVKKFNYLNR